MQFSHLVSPKKWLLACFPHSIKYVLLLPRSKCPLTLHFKTHLAEIQSEIHNIFDIATILDSGSAGLNNAAC